jgi:DnaJ family protein C protein 7
MDEVTVAPDDPIITGENEITSTTTAATTFTPLVEDSIADQDQEQEGQRRDTNTTYFDEHNPDPDQVIGSSEDPITIIDDDIADVDSESQEDDIIFVESVEKTKPIPGTGKFLGYINIADSDDDISSDSGSESDTVEEEKPKPFPYPWPNKPARNLSVTVEESELSADNIKMEVDGEPSPSVVPPPVPPVVNGKSSNRNRNRRRKGKGALGTTADPTVVDLTDEKDEVSLPEDEDEPMQTEPISSSSQGQGDQSADNDVEILNAEETVPFETIPDSDDEESQAEEFKKKGNELYKSKNYLAAIDMYSHAIRLRMFEASYYGNRAACYLMMNKFAEAQVDSRKSIQIDETFDKGYVRLFKSTLHLGDTSACTTLVNMISELPDAVKAKIDLTGLKMSLDNLKQHRVELDKDLEKKDFRKALFTVGLGLNIATADLHLLTMKADILYKLGRYSEAALLTQDIMRKNDKIPETSFLAGKCSYQVDNMERASSFCKKALQLAPDFTSVQVFLRKIKALHELRNEGRKSFEAGGKFLDAKAKYTEALRQIQADPDLKNPLIESKLAYNLGVTSCKFTGGQEESIKMFTKAIELNPSYVKAFSSRAQLYFNMEKFEESLRDYEALIQLEPTERVWKMKQQETAVAVKKAKRKDYYKILGVERNATDVEIKRAYKIKALKYHPDRHSSAEDSVKKENEKNFKDLGEAYEILSDQKKRNRYDIGEDLSESHGHSGYDPFESSSHLFNMFYSTGGMGGQYGRQHSHGFPPNFRAGHGHGGCPR